MAKSKYRKYIAEEVIFKSKYPEILAPMVSYRGDSSGTDLTFDCSCISEPLIIGDLPPVCDFDRFIFLVGSNPENAEFGAKVEISLGEQGQKFLVREPKFIYIPGGMNLGVINFRQVLKPVTFMIFQLSTKYSQKVTGLPLEKYVSNARECRGNLEIKTFFHGQPSRTQTVADHQIVCKGQEAGGGNLCLFWFSAIKQPFLLPEPPHAHHFGMWMVFLGGNPLHFDDFDAEIGLRWGNESAGLLIDSTCVVQVPPEMIHRSTDIQRVTQPFVLINIFASPDYFKDEMFSQDNDIKLIGGST
jgi:hypothetical protein